MVAQRLLRKLHIMPLCPIRRFFNYTFIAFVEARLPENDSQLQLGIRHQYTKETKKKEGDKYTDGGQSLLF